MLERNATGSSKGRWKTPRLMRKQFTSRGLSLHYKGKWHPAQERAEVLSQYYAEVQFGPAEVTAAQKHAISTAPPLFDSQCQIPVTPFTHEELAVVMSKLQKNKATGHDENLNEASAFQQLHG